MFRTEAIKIETGSEDEDGMLVFKGQRLVAVFVRLADRSHEQGLSGLWNLEIRFDVPAAEAHPLFRDIEHGLAWLEETERAAG